MEMKLGTADASGRRRPLTVAGSEYRIPVDSVIAAVSQETDWSGLEPYHFDRDASRIDRSGKTAEHVWAGGDVLSLGVAGTAIGTGRRAAEAVHTRLRDLPELSPDPYPSGPIEVGPVKLDHYPEHPRAVPLVLPVSGRLQEPDAEIHRGITEAQFLEEVSRCLSCGQCFGCEQCWMYCPHTCFSRLEDVKPGMYYAVTLEKCQACGKCIDVCPCDFLQIRAPEAAE
jgi:Pyruvate/2-oxoacid:ferredoxin oxidoreductase delta subunit